MDSGFTMPSADLPKTSRGVPIVWRSFSLKKRILLVVGALACLTIGGGLISIWYSVQTNIFIKTVVDENIVALNAADNLEIALVMQKGYITYFFQDNDPYWLTELESQHHEFLNWLDQAKQITKTTTEREILEKIEAEYEVLNELRNKVIHFYKTGKKQEGADLHQTAREIFFQILGHAEHYRQVHRAIIKGGREEISKRTEYMTTLALAAMPAAMILSILLVLILLRQVLGPIRRLVEVTTSDRADTIQGDDVQILSHEVYDLIEDVETSRSQLIQASKMASVGKLAASVAHSVRNPLTSVKMRLFSLERSLTLTESQLEDLKVISQEIRNIDNILANFLEFSRRPKLKVQLVSPSEVVDMALSLVKPRIESHGITVIHTRQRYLPKIELDPYQLKEAVVNLLVNAMESVGQDGRIEILENSSPESRTVTISIKDNGPGVPEDMREQIFQPFFSTKDEGTGLGLSISMRIVDEHGGQVNIESVMGNGTTFRIVLPLKEV